MTFTKNKSNENEIYVHLTEVSPYFTPPLDSYVDITSYSNKLADFSQRYEYIVNDKLEGLIGGYINHRENMFFISNFSISKKFQGKGIAKELLNFLEKDLKLEGDKFKLKLEVDSENLKALKFYLSNGFVIELEQKGKIICKKQLTRNHT